MLTITARLFKDNQLVGYRLSDGQREQDFTKQQAWLYAKNKQILNVVATGTEADPGLSGTNGFELKKLPEIKLNEQQKINPDKKYYTEQEVTAALIRNVFNTGNINYHNGSRKQALEYKKQCLKDDIKSGVLNENNSKEYSKYLLVENTLYDAFNKVGKYDIGYKVKNIGDQSIIITRMAATPDHEACMITLSPNKSICLSRAEMALLGSMPEVGCTFANGKVTGGVDSILTKADTLYKYLDEFIFWFTDDKSKVKDAEDIRVVVEPEIVDKYFCSPVQQPAKSDEKVVTPKKKSIFSMFKR